MWVCVRHDASGYTGSCTACALERQRRCPTCSGTGQVTRTNHDWSCEITQSQLIPLGGQHTQILMPQCTCGFSPTLTRGGTNESP